MTGDPHLYETLTPPPGRVKGCLYRGSLPGAVCPLASERIKTIPQREWSDLIPRIDLRPKVPSVFDQNGNGSCATESATGGVKVCRSMNRMPFMELNPLFVYHTTSGGRDSGSNIDSNLAFIREHGVAPESVWPRSKGFLKTPSEEAKHAALRYRIDEFFDIQTWEEFGSALLQGFAVVWGYSGHSILATGLTDENTIEYLNSWGMWGDQGYGRARSRSIVWGYGAWAIRSVIVPEEEDDDIPKPATA